MFSGENGSLPISTTMIIYNLKLFSLTFFCWSIVNYCLAQEGWNIIYNQRSTLSNEIPASLKEKEKNLLQRNNVEIKALGLSPDGGWVCAYEAAGLPYLSWDGAPRDLMSTLQQLKEEKVNIQQIVFSPLSWSGKSSWVVLYDNTEVDWKNVPPTLISKILELHQNRQKIKSIALAINGGWALVSDKKVYSHLIPKPMQQQLQRLEKQNADIHYVAFNADNGWIILYDNNQGVWERLPNNLVTTLERLSSQRSHIRAVHFYTLRGRL